MWDVLRQSGGITGTLFIAHLWEEGKNKIYKKASWKPTDPHGRKEMTQRWGKRHGWVTWLKEPLFLWFSSLRHTYTHNVSFAKLRCVCSVGPPRPMWCLGNYHPRESIHISESTPPELDPAEKMYFSFSSPKWTLRAIQNDYRTHDSLLIKHLARNWGYSFGSKLQMKQEMLK